MSNKLLEIKNLHVNVEDKEILKGIDLTINKGEIHVIMGPNGSGKTTTANAILSNPLYNKVEGNINFESEDITNLKTDEIARKGVFMSFQLPEEIPGISVTNFLKSAKGKITGKPTKVFEFKDELRKYMEELKMNPEYAGRSLNVGFSGGEKKKNEILQMLVLNPKLAILDETDSGLDVDAIRTVSKGIEMFKNENNAVLIITHNTKILKSLKVDYVHILVNGKIVKTGDQSLIAGKEAMGFGDVKLMGALGLYFGVANIIIISVMSFLLGAIISIILLATKKKKTDEYIPFGPFIVLATLVAIIVPSEMLLFVLFKIFTLGMYKE